MAKHLLDRDRRAICGTFNAMPFVETPAEVTCKRCYKSMAIRGIELTTEQVESARWALGAATYRRLTQRQTG